MKILLYFIFLFVLLSCSKTNTQNQNATLNNTYSPSGSLVFIFIDSTYTFDNNLEYYTEYPSYSGNGFDYIISYSDSSGTDFSIKWYTEYSVYQFEFSVYGVLQFSRTVNGEHSSWTSFTTSQPSVSIDFTLYGAAGQDGIFSGRINNLEGTTVSVTGSFQMLD